MADVEEVQSPLPKGSLFTAGSIAANTPRVLKIPTLGQVKFPNFLNTTPKML